MNRWTYLIIALLLVPLQTTWSSAVSLHAVRPNLVLLFVYFTGYYAGELKGLTAGLAMGFVMDLFSGGPPGLSLSTEAAAGLLSGLLGRFFLNTTGALTMGMVLLLSIVYGIMVFSFHEWVLGGILFVDAFRWTILPEALYNTLIGGIVFWAVINRLDIKKSWSDSSTLTTPLG
jgi:rod shape-determining protein MreD